MSGINPVSKPSYLFKNENPASIGLSPNVGYKYTYELCSERSISGCVNIVDGPAPSEISIDTTTINYAVAYSL